MFYKQMSDARSSAKELLLALDDSKLDAKKKLKIQKEAQQTIDFLNKMPGGVYNDPNVEMRPSVVLPKLSDKNPQYPAMSKAISFK